MPFRCGTTWSAHANVSASRDGTDDAPSGTVSGGDAGAGRFVGAAAAAPGAGFEGGCGRAAVAGSVRRARAPSVARREGAATGALSPASGAVSVARSALVVVAGGRPDAR